MKTSKKGAEFIADYEKFMSKPYLDQAGVPTIGYGATFYENGVKVKMTDPLITKDRALRLKQYHLSVFEKTVNKLVKSNINQNQFDALVSFAYNVGESALKSSTLLRKVNANPNDPSILNEFAKWNKVTVNGRKVISNGLTRRRKDEAEMYFSK
ncbi:lysozyme [Weeksella virosa]|uniref:Lysozyme n=1 Tax=Weeksella virosa (strain ATCC 43766 / DSM 16922 / JCM 21250 / CCUG 30538 / CDC 9751 / IAM 14551 / NBRC 16016 / NCTC 11634 / CL345/78) TaxID=865938 RepID=F0P2T2_WEEVC|nr:lysozyme [Weeksella virosa]ADX66822.1 glycoside hydrolase family 24 [Weeksella virosa DSM 16922]MDK7675118.1 lysozyme [Weeksella virosa]VEH63454.1 Phage-related lysozyme (muraminidase) [Weeksella virosa]